MLPTCACHPVLGIAHEDAGVLTKLIFMFKARKAWSISYNYTDDITTLNACLFDNRIKYFLNGFSYGRLLLWLTMLDIK